MEYPEREVLRDGTGQGAQIRGANMMFRKILFDRLGLFETSLGRLGNKLGTTEDDDFVWRAVKAGHTLVYDPRLAVDHRIGPDRLRRSYFLRWTFDTAEIDIAHEPPPSPPLWLGVPRWQYAALARATLKCVQTMVRRAPDAVERLCDVAEGLGRMRGLMRTRHAQPGGADRSARSA